MKKVIIILHIYFIFTATLMAQFSQNWQVLSVSTPLKVVTFNNSGTGYIYGDKIRYKILNGGFLPSFHIEKILNPCNVEDGFSFALKDSSVNNKSVYFSVNGGENWGEKILPSYPNTHFNDIKFINKHTGWMVGGYNNSYNFIIKTTNSGDNWSTQNGGTAGVITSIYPIDTLKAFATTYSESYSNNRILRTTNGGGSWQLISINTINRLVKVIFVDSQTGWIFNDTNKSMKTTDGGSTWVQSDLPAVPGFAFGSVHFINNNTGWIVGKSRYVLKTTNGGLNWNFATANPYLPVNSYLTSIFFTDQNNGWISTDNGEILKTSNGGQSWDMQINPLKKISRGVSMNNNLIFVADNNKLYKLTNNARQKDLILTSSGGIIQFFRFSDVKLYFRTESVLYRTTDQGANFSSIPIPILYNCFFINENIGYGVKNEFFYKTTNSGENWNMHDIIGLQELHDVKFLNETIGYLSGETTDSIKVFKSTNGGNSWSLVFGLSTTVNSNTVKIVNLSTNLCLVEHYMSWAVGSLPFTRVVYHGSIDNGNTWEQRYSWANVGLYYTNTGFANDNTGFSLIRNVNDLLRTTNSGYNFTNIANNFPFGILDYYFDNDDNGWFFGDSGLILTNSKINVSVNPISSEIPSAHHLHQNYPNPFNPSTRIKFDIPKGALVRLKVYDILGREVAELVNEKLTAGVYEYQWNGVGLPSGVYFYKLEAENFIETKRMVLVK